MNKIQQKFVLDVKDKHLIRELEINSRESMTKIAKGVNVSKEVANYRLRRLEKEGFIKGYRLVADYSALGFQIYRLLLNLSNIRQNTKSDIIEDLKKSELASFNALLQSVWDMEIIVRAQTTTEFYEFYDSFIEKYSEFILDKDFSIILKTHFLGHPYITGARYPLSVGQQKKQPADEKDFLIVETLSQNSRMGTKDIARKLRIPASTASYKIKSLVEKGIIKGFRPILNTGMLGYTRYKIEVTLNNPSEKKSIMRYLVMKHNTTKIIELMGKYDLEFHADFRNPLEAEGFLMELRTRFHSIKDYEVIPILKDDAQHAF